MVFRKINAFLNNNSELTFHFEINCPDFGISKENG